MHISKFWIQAFLGGAMGLALAYYGLPITTLGFWIIVALALAMRLVGDE